jgi:hypothetical protein
MQLHLLHRYLFGNQYRKKDSSELFAAAVLTESYFTAVSMTEIHNRDRFDLTAAKA